MSTATSSSVSSSSANTTAGPWVDQDRSQSEPLPPVNEHDTRPAVRDLIDQHADTIESIRQKLQEDPLYNPIKHDDLWILRYVLSHKTVEKATPAAKQYLVYRQELGLDEHDLRDAPPGPECPVEGVRRWYNHGCNGNVDALQFSQPDPDRGVVMMIHLAGLDQNKIADISDEDWPFWYFMEWMFQTLDSVTRRTGRLTKGVRFIDLKGYSTSMNNKDCINRNSKNARECQDHYPQMLASVYVLNAPTWGQMVFRMVKPLLPKRFVEKFAIINGSTLIKQVAKKALKDSNGILKHMSVSHLPSKFGGDFQQWPYPAKIHMA
mmetsp:Transcript_6782/g.11249  ORF Transcript_6782/g.11249 Transcript_6782/m.11249 type:complete len:321 (+) Transcript_6782:437-1399(+)|eukprot:CAMPEP_0119010966 /NCGR_PEP_ID=MMETSP1176-20130426/5364_1 /TAXON_ID=265551 /ORGANISM="Synedropsis recta cf, Strain CCMP1620" /LENGTH=320 /DNA_ID=CAMNT_0006963717 /DNA_START=418 /DNA_END=1380 /DNA_ORIENTATION=+